jgi:hypothetical protein
METERGLICRWVFHRDGKRIKNFRKAWKEACTAAGVPVGARTISVGRPFAIWSALACRAESRCN